MRQSGRNQRARGRAVSVSAALAATALALALPGCGTESTPAGPSGIEVELSGSIVQVTRQVTATATQPGRDGCDIVNTIGGEVIWCECGR